MNDNAVTAEILKAAERMAAEINNWKDAFKTKVVDNEELERGFNNAIAEIVKLNDEIDRLKAELASRPEVVYCKDCRSIQYEYSQDEDGRIIAELLVCGINGRPIYDSDFCSLGVKKENEREGKK